MLKKLSIIIVLLAIAIIAAAPSLLGFSIFNLGHAISVSTGLTAKLGCSARYVSGFDNTQVVEDLASYSPVANIVDMQYSETDKSVTSSLYGLATTSASYVDGVGCSLDFENKAVHSALTMKNVEVSNNEWPLGESVNSIDLRIQTFLDQMLVDDNNRGFNSRAMLVVKGGKIIAESYGPKIDKQTRLLGWSMAKSVTAIMLGNLELQGRLTRQQASLFSTWLNDKRNLITLEQMLHMSSGLGFDETYAPGSDATHMLFTAKSAANVAIESDLVYGPGTHFSYSSGTTNLLSYFIHQTLGSDPQNDLDYLHEEIFAPLAMSHSTFEMDTSGVFVGSSYLYSSGRDWARLGQLMLNKGLLNGHRIVSEAWIEQAQSPNLSNNEKAYGYQFWLNSGDAELRWPELPSDAYAMKGNRKQSVMIIPSENTVFVRLGWTTGDYPMANNYKRLLDAINQL